MNSKTTNLILTTALVALAAPAHAQVRAVKVVPAQTVPAQAIPIAPGQASIRPDPVDSGDDAPIDPAASVIPGLEKQGMDAVPPAAATPFSPAEIEELKKLFASLEEPEQAEMRAYYADFGIDLDAALGLAAERNADVQRGQMISNFMREMDFTRKPEAVLAARAKLGFGGVAQPNPTTAQPMEVARWIHLQVMAGETSSRGRCRRSRACSSRLRRSTRRARCSPPSAPARASSARATRRGAAAPSSSSPARGCSPRRTSSCPRSTPRARRRTARR